MWLIIQAIVFSLIALSFIVGSGFYSCANGICGLHISSWHMHDALWHLSLMRLSFHSWPFTNPFMSGVSLSGYNYLLDLLMYGLTRLGLNPLFIFFRLIPLSSCLLYCYVVIRFVKTKYPSSILGQNLLAFFLFFGNSMSYLATLYHDHTFTYATLRGFPVVTSIVPTTMFLNLQFSFSLSFLLILILTLNSHKKSRSFLVALLIFVLFGLKFYAGFVGLLIIGFELFRTKSKLSLALATIIGSLIAYRLFYFNQSIGLPFSFAPLALTHLMIDDSLLFYNHNLTLARYFLYENLKTFSPRLILIESYSLILFILINFGSRIIAVITSISDFLRHKLKSDNLLYLIISLTTLLIPVMFVQNGGWYNTMQFLYYGVWFAGILTAEFILNTKNKVSQITLIIFFVITTIPNTIEQLSYFAKPMQVITDSELTALNILAKEPLGVVHLSDPVKKNGYVPALAGQYPYYLDTDQLMVMGVSYQQRLDEIKKYSGGSIQVIPADYFLIYKDDVGGDTAYKNLKDQQHMTVLYDDRLVALFARKR